MSGQSRPPLILLGAGASRPAGVPLAAEMTREMERRLIEKEAESDEHRCHRKAFDLIVGGLRMSGGRDEPQVTSEIDIERVMSAARLLANRYDATLAPFVGTWHPMIDGVEREQIAQQMNMAVALARLGMFQLPADQIAGLQDLDDPQSVALALSQYIHAKPDGAVFRELSELLTLFLVELAHVRDKERISYLCPMIERARSRPMTVATLNYDNSVELCAAELGISCATGVDEWRMHGRLPAPPGAGIELLKLHGSINWHWTLDPAPHPSPSLLWCRYIISIDTDDLPQYLKGRTKGDRLGVIFGGGNKLTAEGPFLDLLARFKEALWQHSELAVIGYSFRDDHVNQCIVRWLRASEDRKIIVVEREKFSPDVHPLLRILDQDHRSRLRLICTGAESGISQCFGNRPPV